MSKHLNVNFKSPKFGSELNLLNKSHPKKFNKTKKFLNVY